MPASRCSFTPQGPTVARFAVGLWRLADWDYSVAERRAYIDACLALGLDTFDHADIYGDYACEALFGEALAEEPSLREQMVLITKCDIQLTSSRFPERRLNHYDTSADHIVASAEASLRALRTDHLDVLLLHRPDPLMDADEVADAFTRLEKQGKVRHFGVSNFSPSQFALLQDRLPFPLVTNQVECSVLQFDVMHDGTFDQAQRLRRSPMAWSPLGGGRLFTSADAQAQRVRQVLERLGAASGGQGIDTMAFAWLLRHPAQIIPVLGTRSPERLAQAVDAESIRMTREDWFEVWRASKGHDVP